MLNFLLELIIPVGEIASSAYIDSVVARRRRLDLIKFTRKFSSEIKSCYENGKIITSESGAIVVERFQRIKFKSISQLNKELKYIKINKCDLATTAYRKQEYESRNIVELLNKLSSRNLVVVQENYDLYPFGKCLCVAIY